MQRDQNYYQDEFTGNSGVFVTKWRSKVIETVHPAFSNSGKKVQEKKALTDLWTSSF